MNGTASLWLELNPDRPVLGVGSKILGFRTVHAIAAVEEMVRKAREGHERGETVPVPTIRPRLVPPAAPRDITEAEMAYFEQLAEVEKMIAEGRL